MERMLATVGFAVTDIVESSPTTTAAGVKPGRKTCHAIVARRAA